MPSSCSKQTDGDLSHERNVAVDLERPYSTAYIGRYVHGKYLYSLHVASYLYKYMYGQMQLMRRMRFGVAALAAGAVPLRPNEM